MHCGTISDGFSLPYLSACLRQGVRGTAGVTSEAAAETPPVAGSLSRSEAPELAVLCPQFVVQQV